MEKDQQDQPRPTQGGSLSIQDLILVVFKHKWKILLLTLLGFAGAAVTYVKRTPTYESRAKLLVKYVLERPGIDEFESKKEVGGRGGQEVIDAEIELLTSLDLAAAVAETVGPEHFGSSTPSGAAGRILSDLEVGAKKGSNVIQISYRHEDPRYAREALTELVNRYLREHLRVHRSGGAFESVAEEREAVRLARGSTEAELNRLKEENRIVNSVAETAAAVEAQTAAAWNALMGAKADFLEQEAVVKGIEKDLGIVRKEGVGAEGAPGPANDEDAPPPQLGAHVLNEYRALSGRLAALQAQELELLSVFKPQNGKVVRVRNLIQQMQDQQQALVEKHPQLLANDARVQGDGGRLGPQPDLTTERGKLAGLAARVKELEQQHRAHTERRDKILADRGQIERLERKLAEENEKYRLLTTSHDKARVDQTLNPANMPNISPLQNPSAPAKTYNERTTKIMYGLAASGLVAGLCLAFFFELILDGRIKQPIEIETRLRMPLLLSIPYVGRKQRHLALEHRENSKLQLESVNGEPNGNGQDRAMPLSGALSHVDFLLPYAEAIRDRLVYYFELNNMTHKPKLVAFAGFTEGAGTTTLATSVARSFAEEDDAKVLLVDMNPSEQADGSENGSSSPLGLLKVGNEPLGRNLFLASAPQRVQGGGTRALAPKSFYDLMPKFRASEFDYIIFDMPPVGQTSPTLSMAGFMDQVLLVLDAENTNRERLKRAHSQLLDGKADVTCVVNKTRRHAPRWVQAEV